MPTFKPEISLGSIATIATMLVSVTLAYGQITSEITLQREVMARQEAAIEEIRAAHSAAVQQARADDVAKEARIRALELGAGRTEEKLFSILSTLERIENLVGGGN